MSSMNINNNQVEIDDFKGIVPSTLEDIIVTDTTQSGNTTIQGKYKTRGIKAPVDITVVCLPSLNNYDSCNATIKIQEAWRFNKTFPYLPDNFIGNGQFRSSFFKKLAFTSIDFHLLKSSVESYFKFNGQINISQSYPIAWISNLISIPVIEIAGTADYKANRLELSYNLGSGTIIQNQLEVTNSKVILFSKLEAKGSDNKDGIELKGKLKLFGERDLELTTILPTHGFEYMELRAKGKKDITISYLIEKFGLGSDLLPESFQTLEPGLDSFYSAINLKERKIRELELKLSSDKAWKIFDKFSIGQLYLDVDATNVNQANQKLCIEIGGTLELYGGKVDISASYPDYEIKGDLQEESKIQLGAILKDIVGTDTSDLPEGIANLVITDLDFKANTTKKEYELGVYIDTDWSFNNEKFTISKLGGSISYYHDEDEDEDVIECNFEGNLSIGAANLSASVEIEKDDWEITAYLDYDEDDPMVEFTDIDRNGSSILPSQLNSSFSISDLDLTLKKGGDYNIKGQSEMSLSVGNQRAINLDLDVEINKESGKYSGHIYSDITFSLDKDAQEKDKIPLMLNYDFGTDEKELVFGLQEDKELPLKTLITALISAEAAKVMPDLTINELTLTVTNDGFEVKVDIQNDGQTLDLGTTQTSDGSQGKSDLQLDHLQFDLSYNDEKVESCKLSLDGQGALNDDIEFTVLHLKYEYTSKDWSVSGNVKADAYGTEGIDLAVEYAKTETNSSFTFDAHGTEENPIIDLDFFKMKTLEIIITKEHEQ